MDTYYLGFRIELNFKGVILKRRLNDHTLKFTPTLVTIKYIY